MGARSNHGATRFMKRVGFGARWRRVRGRPPSGNGRLTTVTATVCQWSVTRDDSGNISVGPHSNVCASLLDSAAAARPVAMSHVSPEVLSLRRQLRDASLETIRVRKVAERDAARADSLTSEIASARRAAAAASSDVERLSREVVSLRAARDDAAAALEENNVYVKKLEVRVTGSAGSFLVEQNTKLRASLSDANAAHSGCAKLLDAQRRELERALHEIEVLATALDLRASELSRDAPAGGSIQSAMLYEVSARRDEAARARADAETERARADALEFSLREARVAAATAAEVERAQRDRAAELGREAAEARAELKSERAVRFYIAACCAPPQYATPSLDPSHNSPPHFSFARRSSTSATFLLTTLQSNPAGSPKRSCASRLQQSARRRQSRTRQLRFPPVRARKNPRAPCRRLLLHLRKRSVWNAWLWRMRLRVSPLRRVRPRAQRVRPHP